MYQISRTLLDRFSGKHPLNTNIRQSSCCITDKNIVKKIDDKKICANLKCIGILQKMVAGLLCIAIKKRQYHYVNEEKI